MAAPMSMKLKISGNAHFDPKIYKKLTKIARKLSCKESIKFSDSPSSILCVQNGGLGNDVCQEELLSLLILFGEVENIIMLPQKPFCFVYFANNSIAAAVFEKLNGHILKKGKDPSQDVVLFFLYVDKAPDHVMSSNEKPPGLHVVSDFVDEETEKTLLSLMVDHSKSESGSSMKHRQVKHYGYEFRYDINDVDVKDPLPGGLPAVCLPIVQKAKNLGLVDHCPDQLTINQYQPGQGIPPHVDTEDAFEDGIMSLSLGSQVVMEFRHPDGRHVSVVLPQRSMLVMTGESRYVWSHGITPRKSDIVPASTGKGLTLQTRDVRTSFTFRKVIFERKKTIDDVKTNSWTIPQTDTEAKELEKEHVHRVYEDIADHFSGTRYKPWPRVVEFLMDHPPHSLMADVGCGNGKCLGINKTMFEIGCDYSTNLASICGSRGFQSCVSDITCLPFRSDMFDVVLCIAVIHHMATQKRRHKALSEVIRILSPGGKALIYVWAMEQHFNKVESKYIKSNRQKQMDIESFVNITEDSLDESIADGVKNASIENEIQNSVCSDYTAVSTETGKISDSSSNSLSKASSSESETHNDNDVCKEKSYNSRGKTLKVHVNRTQFQEQDMLVPWQLKGKDRTKSDEVDDSSVFHRFYHVFKQGELEELCQSFTQCVIRQSYYDQGNWCVVVEKIVIK